MRPLRALPGSRASGHGRRAQALRRHRAAALIAAGAALALAAGAVEAKPKPPKPPKPKPVLTLRTGTEQGALRREQIKVEARSRRGETVTVSAHFVVDGYPEDFPFDLRAQRERLRGGEAVVHFPLSPRQLEVLDFAIKTCRGATLGLTAEIGRGSGTLFQGLKLPRDC